MHACIHACMYGCTHVCITLPSGMSLSREKHSKVSCRCSSSSIVILRPTCPCIEVYCINTHMQNVHIHSQAYMYANIPACFSGPIFTCTYAVYVNVLYLYVCMYVCMYVRTNTHTETHSKLMLIKRKCVH